MALVLPCWEFVAVRLRVAAALGTADETVQLFYHYR